MKEIMQHNYITKVLAVDWSCAEKGKLMNTKNRHYVQ